MKLEELLTKGAPSPQEDDDDDEKAESKTKATNASDEGVENAEDAADESAEKESATGKKKGTRKKRSLNWEEAERGLLLEVIKTKVAFVENRSVDAKSIKAKRLAWSQITKQFNALNFRHRLLEQIQVQWRSMKNSAKREYQQKHPKSEVLEGMRMIEFMEELQKDPVTSRSQTRSAATNGAVNVPLKKELLEMDEDEDMPLAALPNSTNASEDTLQTSTIAIPSPPPSTAGGDSQQESAQPQSAPNRRKRAKAKPLLSHKDDTDGAAGSADNEKTSPTRKRRQRNHSQAQSVLSEDFSTETPAIVNAVAVGQLTPTAVPNETISSMEMEEKYKQQLFKLLKQARLAEIDYARREHEQKLRFEQMEQELKMSYYRQEQDLKLRHMREEHDMRLRQQRREHEARLSVYNLNSSGLNNGEVQQQQQQQGAQEQQAQLPAIGIRCNAKTDYNNVHMDNVATQPQASSSSSSNSTEAALALSANSLAYN
ncbi:transcription factor SPT20 homolog [Drosophila innubila]|uniref:transcription factor SPT20 homolog n=1 Tax=Drosophila innubila TaxID=198719 RepID=UPI00148BCF1D|nr:transcription factor SPT20 homolog [Drosophila innubila]